MYSRGRRIAKADGIGNEKRQTGIFGDGSGTLDVHSNLSLRVEPVILCTIRSPGLLDHVLGFRL